MRKALIGAAAVILAGGLSVLACSAPPAAKPTRPPVPAVEPASTPTPLPSEADSAGEATQRPPIDLLVGETYDIALDSNPTTGYGWEVEYYDGDLELVEQRYEPDSDLVGAGGKEVFVFRGRTVSSGDVVFTYKRSWEDEVLKTERYTIDVLAGRFEEMSLSEAMAIALESECVDAGPLKENASYNKFTGTWWIDLDAEKEFCPLPACVVHGEKEFCPSHACVVNVATKQAEIHWRCMGALPPTAGPSDEPTPLPSEAGSPAEGVPGLLIDLPVGETYEIALDSNPTTGYGWEVEFNDWDLELVEQRFEPDTDAKVEGAGGKEVFVFRGRTVSSGDVVFTYKRSWEDEVLKTERYTFDVLAGRFEEMTLSEALAIASESECVDAGPLMENAIYNKFTGTWWIDLDAEKEFCPNPACVVNVATKEAEINWRCMGVLPPEEEATEPVDVDEPTPESGIFFPQQEPPVGPRVSMVALFLGELVEVDGCLRARDAYDDYLVIWPHDHSLNVEDGAIQVLGEAGEVAVEAGDFVRFSGGEAMSLEGWDENLQAPLPAHCPGRYWIVGTEVARLQDVLLEVQQVIDLPDAARVRVEGHLVAEGEAPVRLCRILLESDPPQCGEPSLSVEGLDLDGTPGLETHEGVTWSPNLVELGGTVRDGVLTID